MRYTLTLLISSLLLIASCTYVQKIQDGTMAFERKQYAVAVDMLKKEFYKEKSRVTKGKIALMLAESYTALNKDVDAIDWYKTAFDNSAGLDALKGYAYALKKSERYKEAQAAFKELGIEIGSPYEYRKEISACKVAANWKKNEAQNAIQISNMDWNSAKSDYAPILYTDNQVLFTSDRPASSGDDIYNWTGNNFSDLFLVSESIVQSFSPQINTADNEGTASFNTTFTEMIFTRCSAEGELDDRYCKLYESQLVDDNWSTPQLLSFTQENINYGHPSLTADGSQLYYACNDPEGWGGFDIWMSERSPDGWSEPTLLSRSINTIGDEKYPYIDKDTLYFASDKHTGMGGLDIFRSYQVDDNQWSPVHNLKPPINSGSDDFGFVIDYNTPLEEGQLQIGYFSSSRMSGKGLDDIYFFEKNIPPPPPVLPEPEKVDTPKVIVYSINLTGFVVENIYQDPSNPNSRVLGRRPISNANVDVKIGSETKKVNTNDSGEFQLALDFNTDYYFFASKSEYLSNDERFSTRGIAKDPNNPVQNFEVEIRLDKIFKNKEIVLDNIYYDFDRSEIRSDAEPTLNALTKILLQNPGISIQLSSHTDCRGNPNYNQDLSQQRAQSVVNYLIKGGIEQSRLSAVGYGENSLLIDCACTRCTEDEHQANRRTTFKILD